MASLTRLQALVRQDGYAFVEGPEMLATLQSMGALDDWDAFAASWNRLELDLYMADGGRYRRRRHAVYELAQGRPLRRLPHQPHFQSLDYNPLHGGVERWFEPVERDIGEGASLHTLLGCCEALFAPLAPDVSRWKVEVHQFRIEARGRDLGQPTPEGMHRDGVDYVLVLLVARHNIASGTTGILDQARRELGSFTLTRPFDAAIVDDARVYHGVTPVQALDPLQPAWRDVLVVTFQRQAPSR